MSAISIQLPDGQKKEFSHPPTILEVAQSIGSRLAADTLGGKVNGKPEVLDLRTCLSDGDALEIVTAKNPLSLEVLRHSAAHIMAEAVQSLWPEVKVTIGPVVQDGFYYDFDSPHRFTPEDLEKIEKKMYEIIGRNAPFVREEWSHQKAIDFFTQQKEPYKVEIISDLKESGNNLPISVYRQGEWLDLCRGPHVQSAGQIKAVKVLSLAGAYWRGDEKRAQLQRIYATAFFGKKELEEHLQRIEEAKRRDHRKVGRELGLFYFHEEAPGSPFFTGKGTIIYSELQTYLRELYREVGYEEVISPQIFDVELFKRSGHYDNYRENMYFIDIDERQFSLKPMNCPGHCLLYASEKRSYRQLPVRMADFGRLHRHERSGVMHGLTRVRTFCQDDAHIFCSLAEMQSEIKNFMELLNRVYQKLGMPNYTIYLSTRPEKRMGSNEVWDKAESALKSALTALGLPFIVNPGEGAFYGPKLDIMFVDALARPWQLGTLQCDFNLPEKFDLSFVGEDNEAHRPVLLHRAILGSLERFIGVYLEHCAGHLPPWLAPTQVAIVTITDKQNEYAQQIRAELLKRGARVQLDDRNEKLGFKIREAQIKRIPYVLVLGQKECETQTVSVRLTGEKSGEENTMIPNIGYKNILDIIHRDISQRVLQTELMNQEAKN